MAINLWDLTVLCLLREADRHPYEMQRLIQQRHKSDFLHLKRGSLYHAIARLVRDGFIEDMGSSREGRRPERTVYRLTAEGETELLDQLRRLLSKPTRTSSPFVAAVSFIAHLPPDEAADHLEMRLAELECGQIALEAVRENLLTRIGRLPLLEVEYILATQRAEAEWVRSLIHEIHNGQLNWDPAKLLKGDSDGQPGSCCGEQK